MGHNIHIARKSTPNFTTSSSLVLIKPILDEIQPFKNSNFYYEVHTDAEQIVRRVRLSIHFLVNFFKFLNGCISFNIGPDPTKLEDFAIAKDRSPSCNCEGSFAFRLCSTSSVNRLQPSDSLQRRRKSMKMQRMLAENFPLS